ncbi:flagellar hook-length control protein FliK [Bacillus sp. Cr_A10]|uniref:flagellar hook-length control protein FliK n=1 Tax=Bacillus sp. Cr_A10 TaxID=3033993 RepID=UPI0023DCE2B8|nr:flagellar hook-length control protein FliK [Bacillus sp. Cr_A10]MDF2066016.1 flagellar hook-length control protein FliK [Bacillus sp. Cr_A10]
MNIAAVANLGNNIVVQSKGKVPDMNTNNQLFGNVFGQVLSNQQVQSPPIPDDSQLNLVQELLNILDVDALEEAESLIGSKDLIVNPKELKELLSKLLGENATTDEELSESNVWDLLAGLNVQASQLKDAIVQSLNGQGPVSSVEASQAVQLLKIIQLIGKKSDLTLKQESTLFDLNQLVKDLKDAVSKEVKLPLTLPTDMSNNKAVNAAMNKLSLDQTMKPSVQQVVIKQVATPTEKVIETREVVSPIQGQSSMIVQTKVETVSVTLPNEKPGQSEEFLKDLQKVMNRVQFGQAGGANRLVVKLYPEHLGTIRIELIQKDGMLTAKMLASTTLGKDLLDSHSNQLRQGLVNQNIQIEKLEITQSVQDSARQERNQSFQESFRQQQERQETKKDEKEEIATFEDFLKEVEV